MLPFTGPRRGSRPFLPRHNRGGPARHLCALCAGSPPPPPSAPPQPLLSVPHRIMDPLCVLGWTRTLFRRKKLCLSVRRDRPRKGTGRSGRQRPSPLLSALALRSPAPAAAVPSAFGEGSPHGCVFTQGIPCTCPTLQNPESILQPKSSTLEPQRGFASPPHPQVPPAPLLRTGSAQPPRDDRCVVLCRHRGMGAQPHHHSRKAQG